MNVCQALNNSYTLLNNNTKTNRLDCEILLAECLKIKNRLDLFLNLNQRLTKDQVTIFFNLIKERQKCKPISKIIKKKRILEFRIRYFKESFNS